MLTSRFFFTNLLLSSCFSIFSQINFNTVNVSLTGAKTDFNCVAIGDINNDGLNDLVIGSGYYFDATYDYNIIIYKQKSDGSLASPTMFRYPTSYPGLDVLQISDLNNDKLNDIVIGYGDSIGIFYQLINGSFGSIKSYFSGYDVDGLKTGDLNNDGLTDIAVCHWNSPYIKIFTQNINGTFTTKSVTIQNAGYDELDIADVNGDNLSDVIYMPGQLMHSTLQILYQKPNVGITDSVFLYKYTGEYYPTLHGIGIGDLNNDGRNDIAGSMGGNTAYMFLMYQDNIGKIGNNNLKISAYDIPTPVEIADLNCDGNNEIVVGHSGWGSITIYEKNLANQYSSYVRYPASYYYSPYSLAVGDLNNDRKLDIVSVDNNAKFTILYNNSKPSTFSKLDTSILNVIVSKDTTKSSTITITAIIDTSSVCKVNRDLQRTITKRIANEHYSGDSLTIRHAPLCNTEYIDSIMKHYSFTVSKIISIDTVNTIINRDAISVNTTSISLNSANNSSRIFYIYSNICWNISANQSWLVVSKSNGSGNSSITLVAIANPSINPRSAVVTITGLGVPTIQIAVTQKGALPSLTTSTSSIILSKAVNNTSYFNVISNVSWEVSVDTNWLKVDKYKGTNNSLLTLQASPNKTGADRCGIVLITGADTIVKTIEVTQLFSSLDSVITPTVIKDSTSTAIGSSVLNDKLSVYPNPVNELLYISNLEQSLNLYVEILDINGKSFIRKNINYGTTRINIGLLDKGLYFVKIYSTKGLFVRKVIKE